MNIRSLFRNKLPKNKKTKDHAGHPVFACRTKPQAPGSRHSLFGSLGGRAKVAQANASIPLPGAIILYRF